MRKANVHYKDEFAGILYETEEGFAFQYDENYLKKEHAKPISLTLPLQQKTFERLDGHFDFMAKFCLGQQ